MSWIHLFIFVQASSAETRHGRECWPWLMWPWSKFRTRDLQTADVHPCSKPNIFLDLNRPFSWNSNEKLMYLRTTLEDTENRILSLLSIKARFEIGEILKAETKYLAWLPVFSDSLCFFSAFYRCKIETNKILNVNTGCMWTVFVSVWEHVLKCSSPWYSGVTSDMWRVPIFREGKMDIKMLDELLRGTIDPTHRNEAEKKLTEVMHFSLYITFGVVRFGFIFVVRSCQAKSKSQKFVTTLKKNMGSGSGKKPIPDPGSGSRGQKAPDPGSGSATLLTCRSVKSTPGLCRWPVASQPYSHEFMWMDLPVTNTCFVSY